ncbi:complex I intermediate-associated protein 30-domain-containing protein [Dimargaris cristalligena]|uniref:Complex I intermediate-associated protein 30-domain-containing protein n=1 Tax=Dimargaris cristalligena TaxID=215637 RepID=A0A4P9ZQ07_9FUNG|nr:complex I intermediate-associated protein 30-domain-containing protein [Dimargaris cristalligena]|eukprot:RKP35453.1 complex I intermediate-associated protein 30-domain-containing protein [Dimargaris cristalligena]
MSLEHLKWKPEMDMYKLNTAADVDRWVVGSDKDIGGYSTAKLEITEANTGLFHGHLSQDIPNDAKIVRSGYAAIRSKKNEKVMLQEAAWDTVPFRYLSLRVKGDRRKYLVNISTSSFIKTDLYQHRLFLRTPGQWEIVHLPFRFFAMTNNGSFVSQHIDMYREMVETIGISLSDKQPGPFRLEIDWIKATNTEDTDGDYDRMDYGRMKFRFR